jgi:hypothetical protein
MKSTTILMVLLVVGCEPPGQARDATSDRATAASSAHRVPPQRYSGRYRLVGLPTGPRLFFNQTRCLRTLRTYADGMEAGLGSGSSTQLRCKPE